MKQLLMATRLRQGKRPRGEGLHAASAGTQTLATGTKARGFTGGSRRYPAAVAVSTIGSGALVVERQQETLTIAREPVVQQECRQGVMLFRAGGMGREHGLATALSAHPV